MLVMSHRRVSLLLQIRFEQVEGSVNVRMNLTALQARCALSVVLPSDFVPKGNVVGV